MRNNKRNLQVKIDFFFSKWLPLKGLIPKSFFSFCKILSVGVSQQKSRVFHIPSYLFSVDFCLTLPLGWLHILRLFNLLRCFDVFYKYVVHHLINMSARHMRIFWGLRILRIISKRFRFYFRFHSKLSCFNVRGQERKLQNVNNVLFFCSNPFVESSWESVYSHFIWTTKHSLSHRCCCIYTYVNEEENS